jgi:hypothetical protein
MIAGLLAALVLGAAAPIPASEVLPARVRRIVLHTLGGPSYDRPERRFVFFAPLETQGLWAPQFGAHWIVWTDGSLWPRHPRRGEARSWTLSADAAASHDQRERLAREAAPVYAHVYGANEESLGVELSHSGRSSDPFPEAQLRGVALLLKTLLAMSNGRLGPADVVGHKDLDRRPAYVSPSCEYAGCSYFVDDEGRAFHRRVDPPESLFLQLKKEGLAIPRPADGDAELRRAEAIPAGVRPESGDRR